jgi:2-polyprenyl-6-methoxyphenol hydroxylase-like FAD-dependent oxidoreductase
VERSARVLVIGAGIGGLSLVLALQRLGFDAVAFEQAPALGEVGAGLGVWTSAVRALRKLGVDESLFARAMPIRRVGGATPDGRVLSSLDVTALTAEYGADSYVMHRAALHRALVDAIEPWRIVCGARCVSVREDGDRVIARFDGGRDERGAIVVGADGMHSVVRAALWGESPPRYSGDTCFRGVATLRPRDANLLCEIEGVAQRCSVAAIDADRVYWWCAYGWPEGDTIEPAARKRALLDRYRDFAGDILPAIEATPDEAILHNDLYDRDPIATWSRGRITLLGDAAHPTTPNLGQGACMAIEDAFVLARALAHESQPTRAFAEYERTRLGRTRDIVLRSRRFGDMFRWRNAAAITMREWMVRATPAFVMRRMMREQIGYDVGELA